MGIRASIYAFLTLKPSSIRAIRNKRIAIDGGRVWKHLEFGVNTVSPKRIKIARTIAICADFVQIVLPFVFAEGFLSPFDDVLDVVVCFTLTWLVGWHFAFLPSFVIKVMPMADLAPTWTIAVFVATRQKQVPPQPSTVVTEVYAEPVPQSPPQIKNPSS